MANILWLESAIADLEEVASQKDRLAIARKVEMLADFPNLGTEMCGEWSGFRRTLAANHWIVYRVLSPEQVGIAYIRHTRRRFPRWPSLAELE